MSFVLKLSFSGIFVSRKRLTQSHSGMANTGLARSESLSKVQRSLHLLPPAIPPVSRHIAAVLHIGTLISSIPTKP